MVVLFVCLGNTYRSRLAEAYLKSLQIPRIQVRSAGVLAYQNLQGPISDYARRLLHDQDLEQYTSLTWTQLTQELIDQANVVICLNRQVHSTARASGISFPSQTFIWDIPDIHRVLSSHHKYPERANHAVQMTFRRIQHRVQELLSLIHRPPCPEHIDIYQPDGTPLGRTEGIDTALRQGLWHLGVHAALYTRSGQVVLEKRSATILTNPGLWDLTLGGFVAAGETPQQALVRETHEELGIRIDPDRVTKLWVYRYNHHLPHYGLHSRTLLHTYLVEVTDPHFKLQASEVAEVRLLDIAEAEDLMLTGHSALGHTYARLAFNRNLLAAIKKTISTI